MGLLRGHHPRNGNFPTVFTVNTLPEFQIEKECKVANSFIMFDTVAIVL